MSGKSIFLSILSLILFVGVIFALVMIFKTQPILILPGFLLFIIPVAVRNKASDAAQGKFDELFAKYVVPALAVVLSLVAIMAVAFWIQL